MFSSCLCLEQSRRSSVRSVLQLNKQKLSTRLQSWQSHGAQRPITNESTNKYNADHTPASRPFAVIWYMHSAQVPNALQHLNRPLHRHVTQLIAYPERHDQSQLERIQTYGIIPKRKLQCISLIGYLNVIYNKNTSRCILMYPTHEYSCGLASHMDRSL